MTKTYFLCAGSETLFPEDFSDITQEFVAKIQSYFPSNPVVWKGLDEIHKALVEKVEEAKEFYPDAVVVSLHSIYYPEASERIECNRLVDKKGNKLGLANRPNTKPLLGQVRSVMEIAQNQPIIVVDDTYFHGDTLNLLSREGLRIDGVIEYFADMVNVEKAKSKGATWKIFSCCPLGEDEYVDVMPVHDFLPFLPLCGKVVGEAVNGRIHALSNIYGDSFSLPYLMPWITAEQVEGWSCVPVEQALDFSKFAISKTIEILERVEKYDFSTLGSAARYNKLRVSIPYLDGVCEGCEGVEVNKKLIDILQGCLHLLG